MADFIGFILLQYSKYKTLKIVSFRHGEENRVILGLRPSLTDIQDFVGIDGCFSDGLEKQSL